MKRVGIVREKEMYNTRNKGDLKGIWETTESYVSEFLFHKKTKKFGRDILRIKTI